MIGAVDELLRAAATIQVAFLQRGWRFCFIGGVDVDIALGALPFEERTVARASPWEVRKDITLTTCSAEDLVVHKVFAGRDVDWADVEHVLIRQHGKLDLKLLRSELEPLLELKGEPEASHKLERVLATVERRLGAKP